MSDQEAVFEFFIKVAITTVLLILAMKACGMI
jgi:hypothetical protein